MGTASESFDLVDSTIQTASASSNIIVLPSSLNCSRCQRSTTPGLRPQLATSTYVEPSAQGFTHRQSCNVWEQPYRCLQNISPRSLCLLQTEENVTTRPRSSCAWWQPDFLIQYISDCFPLLPGDLLFTGTPHGVGPLQQGQIAEMKWGDKLAYSVEF
ncbi:hypothetical protein WJX74_006559 [Apatococcus lobatus]|uniref:Fumarylacetoacetase-like C-terminal domain-containing protein n=1 Tax=Apatococcus lobatus TaxID=904363 RepID=A0AAW1RDK6_9CHLO